MNEITNATIGPVALLVIMAVCLLVGWLARRFASKKWPDEVAAADALAKSSPERAKIMLRDAQVRAAKKLGEL